MSFSSAWNRSPLAPDEPGLEHSPVDGGEALLLTWREEAPVADVDQVFGDLPEVLVGRHPIDSIESGEIDRVRVAAQRLLAPQIE